MKGTYLLVIELNKDLSIDIGKLGSMEFKSGFYIYVGSALNGLDQRIQRHLKSEKKLHWHIDYLLKHAKIISVFYRESDNREECVIAKALNENLSPVIGFGCSDCKCNSHLFYGFKKEILSSIEKLQMCHYPINANH